MDEGLVQLRDPHTPQEPPQIFSKITKLISLAQVDSGTGQEGAVDKALNFTSMLLCVEVKATSMEAGGGHRETCLRNEGPGTLRNGGEVSGPSQAME